MAKPRHVCPRCKDPQPRKVKDMCQACKMETSTTWKSGAHGAPSKIGGWADSHERRY